MVRTRGSISESKSNVDSENALASIPINSEFDSKKMNESD
jgi:hypothetical protein